MDAMDAMMKLPAHDLAMDVARESEVVPGEDGGHGYRWVMTDTERSHIGGMLNVDGEFRVKPGTRDDEEEEGGRGTFEAYTPYSIRADKPRERHEQGARGQFGILCPYTHTLFCSCIFFLY